MCEFFEYLGVLQSGSGEPARVVGADGTIVELPGPAYEALRNVVEAMSRGLGVTVIPQNALLTTQEAADLLGVSRPTVVRLVEGGEIAHERRGQQRRLRLADVVDYQQRMRIERRAVLGKTAREGQESGLYDATDG